MSKPMKTLYTVNTFGKLIEVQVEAQDAIWTTGSNGRFYLTQLMHETKEAAVADRLKRLHDSLKNAGTKMESIKDAIWHVERLMAPKLGELNFSADAAPDESAPSLNIPEPMRTEPTLGSEYFMPVIVYQSCDLFWKCKWDGGPDALHRLRVGICHATKEAAIQHAMALISLTEAK